MKEPIEWFEETVRSGKYEGDVIDEMKSCISENGFDLNKFVDWVSEQLEKELGED